MGGALLLAWVVLITIEVKLGIVNQLNRAYLVSIILAFGGFISTLSARVRDSPAVSGGIALLRCPIHW